MHSAAFVNKNHRARVCQLDAARQVLSMYLNQSVIILSSRQRCIVCVAPVDGGSCPSRTEWGCRAAQRHTNRPLPAAGHPPHDAVPEVIHNVWVQYILVCAAACVRYPHLTALLPCLRLLPRPSRAAKSTHHQQTAHLCLPVLNVSMQDTGPGPPSRQSTQLTLLLFQTLRGSWSYRE
jgi:hypothetical protein